MDCIKFEWDENKNQMNQRKHKITFDESKTVFYDVEAIVIDDPEHSREEERFIILGFSKKANLLVVCHCYRNQIQSYVLFLQEKQQLLKQDSTMK